MRRHLSWLLPLLLLPLAFFATGFAAQAVSSSDLGVIGMGLASLAIVGAWLAGSIILIIKTIKNSHRVFRAHRRGRGHYTKTERTQLELQRTYESSWAAAKALTARLRQGQLPPELQVWGLILEPTETLHIQINAQYARFYGLNGSYVHTNGFFWGQPAFVLAGLGVTALANSSRRRAAAAASQAQWRGVQQTTMFLTDRRIICQVDGRWFSFHYSQVAAFYPEPANTSVVLEFHGAEPLLIGGPEAPIAAAYLAWALHGEQGLSTHPALESLRTTYARE